MASCVQATKKQTTTEESKSQTASRLLSEQKEKETADFKTRRDSITINGTIWAISNVGASNPEDDGNYYTWKEAQCACPEGWRLPTQAEFESLNNAENQWITINGKNGRKFGSDGNMLFLPAAGSRVTELNILYGKNQFGHYWSSTSHENYKMGAYLLYFNDRNVYPGTLADRECEYSVRCVAKTNE
jgi:uncharacterized protein (TIGR02145 family)